MTTKCRTILPRPFICYTFFLILPIISISVGRINPKKIFTYIIKSSKKYCISKKLFATKLESINSKIPYILIKGCVLDRLNKYCNKLKVQIIKKQIRTKSDNNQKGKTADSIF